VTSALRRGWSPVLALALLVGLVGPVGAAAATGATVRLEAPKDLHAGLRPAGPDPDDGVLATALAQAGTPADAIRALHPDDPWMYVVVPDLHERRGLLRTVWVGDVSKPVLTGEVALSPGLVPTDAVVDADAARLYLASGTHTLVLDVQQPGGPVPYGRIADVMIAGHHGVEVETIADADLGLRTFLRITARWRDVAGCTTGTLHVLDITGRLRDAPIEIAAFDIPTVDITTLDVPVVDDPRSSGTGSSGTGCPRAVLQLDAGDRQMHVDWQLGDGTSAGSATAPYDITTSFQVTALVCRLVRV
jgi:hypothetical protein